MNSKEELLIESLDEARKQRECPPMNLFDSGNELAIAHLNKCESCKKNYDFYKRNKELLSILYESFHSKEVSGTIKKNCICQIKCQPNQRFSDGKYFSPPMVFVLSVNDDNKFVEVAQISNIDNLAYAGDVPISDNDPSFIESWNIYSIHKTMLEFVGGPLPDYIERRVFAESKIDYDSYLSPTLRKFRKLERDVGNFYSKRFFQNNSISVNDNAFSIVAIAHRPISPFFLACGSIIGKHIGNFIEGEFQEFPHIEKSKIAASGTVSGRTYKKITVKKESYSEKLSNVKILGCQEAVTSSNMPILLIINDSLNAQVLSFYNKDIPYKCFIVEKGGYPDEETIRKQYHSFGLNIERDDLNRIFVKEVLVERQQTIRVALEADLSLNVDDDSFRILFRRPAELESK